MLDFLKNISIGVEKEVTKSNGGTKGRVATPLNPTNGADIRLFKDGRVYPSEALVNEFELNYKNKDEQGGKAFDCFKAKDWTLYPQEKEVPNLILIAAVSKDAAKTDLFGHTKYNEDGSPISDVLEQGSSTFGKRLIDMIAEVEGTTKEMMFSDSSYIDLMIVRVDNLKTDNLIYYFPKTVSRGVEKNKMTYERRDNTIPMPLVRWTPTPVEIDSLEVEVDLVGASV